MRKTINSIPSIYFILLLVMVSQITTNNLYAQEEPQYDNTIDILPPEGFIPIPAPNNLAVITSENGYDNFYLGVDFAEPHMSSNPNDPLQYFNVWNTNGTHYTNDGHDWTASSGNFGTFSMRGDPVSAYDSLGNLYYENMYGSPSILGCKVIRSTDNGATWSAPVTAISGVDKNWIAADQTAGPFANYVYTTMTGGPGGNFARSTDFGATWQTTFQPTTQGLPGMMVAVGPDVIGGNNISGGCVYVVTNGGSTFSSTYTFYTSYDGGLTFTLMSAQNFAGYVGTNVSGRHSIENMRTRPYPFITADNSFGPFRGRLYLIYASNFPAGNGNKPDIYLRYSDDQGLTWSNAVTVNDDLNSQNNHQWMPAFWCDKETGRLYAKWYDSRNVPTSDSTDVYATYSDDGGVTWAPNQRITNERMIIDCSTCGGGGTPRYQGDYDAITSNRYSAMAVWADFRNGNFGSYTAYFPDFAMQVSTTGDTLGLADSLDIVIKVPAIKLYEHSVKFSASVSPAANFTFSFPDGDSLSAFPDSLPMKIKYDSISTGSYEVIVQGEGPNGTPVHRRIIKILATAPFVNIQNPNGGEQYYSGTTHPISWEAGLIDTVKIDYSTDGGTTWFPVTVIKNGIINKIPHPKLRNNSYDKISTKLDPTVYDWTIPNTPSNNCLVRISNFSDSTVFDISDAPFSIIPAPLPSWRLQSSGVTASLYSVSIIDTSIAWIGGSGGVIIYTFNGGKTWTQATNVGSDVFSIFALTQNRVFAAANSPGSARILRTFNVGSTWSTVYEDTNSNAFINDVTMFDFNNGFAMGDPVNGQWTLLSTTSSGVAWNPISTLAQAGSEIGWNNSMFWLDDQKGWFGTTNSRIYSTTDGGVNWSPSATSFTNSYTVSFITDSMGMTSGESTDRSNDGGINWSASPGQISGTVFAGVPINLSPSRWYFLSGSDIYRTNDFGETYTLDISHTDSLYHLDMNVFEIGGNQWVCGYAVGEQGTIIKYVELVSVADLNDSNEKQPIKFSLLQNYPNPFNPSTTILFTLPSKAKVTLNIINILGQKVFTLIDDYKNAGEFKTVWDGRNLKGEYVSNGIYFYKLEAKTQSGTHYRSVKKMILLK